MKNPHDITIEGLQELITVFLTKRGFSPDYVAGFLDAQNLSGWTRKNCPAWIRNSAGIHFSIPPNQHFPSSPGKHPDPNKKQETPKK